MKKFWKVEIKDKEYEGEHKTYYVFATSASMAEEKAIKIAKKEDKDLKNLYCTSAVLYGYIAG